MSERLRSASARNQTNSIKMESDLGTRKTLFVLVIVVGCFAILWPKVFYPMLVGSSNQRMKPNSLDKGCCDVISDIDVNTIKIMSELCNNIIQQDGKKPLRGPEIIVKCRTEVLSKCGIDISAVLQEQVRLGRSFKQIVDELRSFNGSLCLKYNFGVSPWSLGVSHRVTFNVMPVYVRQERPAHLRPEMLHPALREKGRAIAHPYSQAGKDSQPKFVEGRPGPVPGIRPPMGAGAGHIVGQQQKGLNSMGIIMPIYTVGIVIFFSYTLMKILFKKKPEGPGAPLYPPIEPSTAFRNEVFEAVKNRPPRQPTSIVNAMSALLEEVDQELEARRKANELASQKEPNGTLANGSVKQPEPDQPSVKVLGMEVTASCEGGEKWSRPESPVIPNTPPPPPEPVEPPQEIYLEGALPAQSQLLVADSTTEEEEADESSTADPAVVLASKMTLSVISVESPEDNIEEKSKLRNGNLVEAAHESLDEEIMDESKYTTASGATAAEHDYSEEELTDDEGNLQEDIEKLPECTVDNGVQHVEDLDALQDEEEIEIDEEEIAEERKEDVRVDEKVNEIEEQEEEEEEEEEVEVDEEIIEAEEKTDIRIDKEEKDGEEEKEDLEKEEDEEIKDPEERQSSIRILVEPADPVSRQDEISAEDMQSIGNVIDDVISAGTRMSELISAKRENDDDENEE